MTVRRISLYSKRAVDDIKDPSSDVCCPPAAPPPEVPSEPAEIARQLAVLGKALGHPIRVTIMQTLLARDTCVVGELVNELPVAQSTVSQHLKQLKLAGLIRGEVDGARICYCVEPGTIALLKALVARL